MTTMDDEIHPAELLERLHEAKRRLVWEPMATVTSLDAIRQRPARAEDPLAYLHAHWALPDGPPPASGRGPRRLLMRVFGRFSFRVLRPYLEAERTLLANVVQTAELLASRCDELAAVLVEFQARHNQHDAELAAWLETNATSEPGTGAD